MVFVTSSFSYLFSFSLSISLSFSSLIYHWISFLHYHHPLLFLPSSSFTITVKLRISSHIFTLSSLNFHIHLLVCATLRSSSLKPSKIFGFVPVTIFPVNITNHQTLPSITLSFFPFGHSSNNTSPSTAPTHYTRPYYGHRTQSLAPLHNQAWVDPCSCCGCV